MEAHILDIVLLSLTVSLIGNFWILCLNTNMIFGTLGRNIRWRIKCEKEECDHADQLCFTTKLLKGLECPFCVSIWILIVTHTLYYRFMSEEELTVMWWIFIFLASTGFVTLFNKIQTVFINHKLPF